VKEVFKEGRRGSEKSEGRKEATGRFDLQPPKKSRRKSSEKVRGKNKKGRANEPTGGAN